MTNQDGSPFTHIPTDHQRSGQYAPQGGQGPTGQGPGSYGPTRTDGYFGTAALSVQQERNVALAAHAIALFLVATTAGTLAWLAPVVMWGLFKDRGRFARHHTAEALNFTIVVGIGMAVSWALTPILIGFVPLVIIWVWAIVQHIRALTAAHRGEMFSYPMTPSFVR